MKKKKEKEEEEEEDEEERKHGKRVEQKTGKAKQVDIDAVWYGCCLIAR